MGKIAISEIEFGKTDAYNELQEVGAVFYMDSFLVHDRYKAESFICGENYFICGNKGTGKTAFLKYLECFFSRDPINLIIPIRFKSDFDDDDKKTIRAVGTNVKEEAIDEKTIGDTSSYVKAWQVYLVNQIITKSESKEGEFYAFENTSEYKKMVILLNALYSEQKERVIPKLSKGYAKINANSLKGIDASLEFDIEFNEQTSKINFQKTARKILELFEQLRYARTPIKILIDELELSVRNSKEYKRDIELIRDLILAIDKLNHLFKKNDYRIQIIASIRSEVINHVLSQGYEINKCVEDFGVTVEWYQKGGSLDDHPLLKIIENKIHASERAKGVEESADIWSAYFSGMINDSKIRPYILSCTWYRPRDIIRMMRLVQDQWKAEDVITQEMFDRALQGYSEKMWNEIAEELTLCYSNIDDIKAIKKFFTGIQVPFTMNYLCERAKELSEIYPYVKAFFDRYKMIEFCEKMFEWGIIGNSGQRMVFSFLGDRELNPTADMILHKPLRNYFAVTSRGKQRG